MSVVVVFERSLGLPFAFGVLGGGCPVTVAICESARCGGGGGGGGAEAAAAGGGGVGSEEEEGWVLQSATDWARTALDDEMAPPQMCKALIAEFIAMVGANGGGGGGGGGGGLPAVAACEAVVWPYGDMDYALDGGCAWLRYVDSKATKLWPDWRRPGLTSARG